MDTTTTETKSSSTIALNAPRGLSKGRNGVFIATAVHVAPWTVTGPPCVILTACSRRHSNNAPLRLCLSPEDAMLVAEALLAAAAATLHQDTKAIVDAASAIV